MLAIDHPHIHCLQQTTSTNDLARDPRYGHGDLICAEFQTAGRGQRGHTWSSPEGANLMFTLVLEPHFLPVTEQFLISEAVALGLVDALARFGIEARIKWTNDIYVGDGKITGILIENDLSGDRLRRSIVGIGLNVNQTEFDPSLPNPVSMRGCTGSPLDRAQVLLTVYDALMRSYRRLEAGDREALQREYREKMYRLGERSPFRLPSGERIEAVIQGVRPGGELMLLHDDGAIRRYLFREIEFIVAR